VLYAPFACGGAQTGARAQKSLQIAMLAIVSNRFGLLGPTRLQIPPPPPHQEAAWLCRFSAYPAPVSAARTELDRARPLPDTGQLGRNSDEELRACDRRRAA
jgi:hypothetical protein